MLPTEQKSSVRWSVKGVGAHGKVCRVGGSHDVSVPEASAAMPRRSRRSARAGDAAAEIGGVDEEGSMTSGLLGIIRADLKADPRFSFST